MAALLISFSLTAQESMIRKKIDVEDVPLEVLRGFQKVHEGKTADVWRMEQLFYQAEYTENGKKYFDMFNPEGRYIETKEIMPWEKAPQSLKEGFNKTEYKYWDVVESYRITNENNNLYYRIQVSNDEDGTDKTIYFDEDGTLEDKSHSGYTQ